MGSAPRWWRVQEAARYLGVAVWDLEAGPWRYVLQAEEAQAALAAASQAKVPHNTT